MGGESLDACVTSHWGQGAGGRREKGGPRCEVKSPKNPKMSRTIASALRSDSHVSRQLLGGRADCFIIRSL